MATQLRLPCHEIAAGRQGGLTRRWLTGEGRYGFFDQPV